MCNCFKSHFPFQLFMFTKHWDYSSLIAISRDKNSCQLLTAENLKVGIAVIHINISSRNLTPTKLTQTHNTQIQILNLNVLKMWTSKVKYDGSVEMSSEI